MFRSRVSEDAEVKRKGSWAIVERGVGPSVMMQWLITFSGQWVRAGVPTAPPPVHEVVVTVGALSSKTWLCTGSASQLKQLVVSPCTHTHPPKQNLKKVF